jgi:autotransporter-associated beta strand protein
LAVAGAGSLTSGTVVVRGGTTNLTLGNTEQTVGSLALVDGTVQLGTLRAAGFGLENGLVSAVLTGSGTALKTTAGTVRFSGANTLSGTLTVDAGSLLVLAGGSLTSGSVTLSGVTAYLGLGNTAQGIGRLNLLDGAVAAGTLTAAQFELEKGLVSAQLAGAAPVTKTTAGLVTLSGANTLSGSMNILVGSLAVTGPGLLTSGSVTVNGSTAVLTLGSTTQNVGAFRLADGIVQDGILGATSFGMENGLVSAVLNGPAAVTKSTGGLVTWTGANTLTGAVDVNAGTLAVSGAGSLSSGSLTVSGMATLTLATTSQTVGAFRLVDGTLTAGTLTAASFGIENGVASTRLSGGALVTKSTGGTVLLSGANTLSGSMDITAGSLVLSGAGLLTSGTVTVSGASTLTLGSTTQSVGDFRLVDGVVEAGVFTASRFDVESGLISAQLNGGAPLTKSTAGTVTLSGANTLSGSMEITAGTLAVNGAGLLTAGSVSVSGASTLTLGNTAQSTGAFRLADGFVDAGTLTATGFALESGAVTAVLNGAAPLTKSTSGVVTLSGANTLTGATTVTDGSLAVTGAGLLTSGSVTVGGLGAFLTLGSTSQSVGAFRLAAGTVEAGTLTATSFAMESGLIRAVLNGAAEFAKSTAARVTLTGANTLSGPMSVTAGSLELSGAGLLTTGTVTVSGGSSYVTLGATEQTIGRLALVDGVVEAGTLSAGTVSLENGLVSAELKAANAVTKTTSGVVTLTGSNSFASGVVQSAGTLQIGHNNALGSGALTFSGGRLSSDGLTDRSVANGLVLSNSLGLGSSVNTGSLTVGGGVDLSAGATLTVDSAVTFTGSVSGAAGVIKLGAAEWTLAGANSLTGTIAVGAGTLTLGGGLALADTAVVALSGAGSLKLSASEEIAAVSGTGFVNVQSSTLTVSGAQSTTLSAALLGTGGLEQKGVNANLTLNSANTGFSGVVFLTAGTVTLGNQLAFGVGGSDTVQFRGGTLAYGAGITTDLSPRIQALAAGTTAYVDIADGTSVTYLTGLSGAGALTKVGEGTLTFGAANVFAGSLEIRSGTIVLGTGGTTGSVSAQILNSGNLAFNRSDFLSVSSYLTGVGSFEQRGTGVVEITSQNDYTGVTRLTNGTLRAGTDTAFGAGILLLSAGRLSSADTTPRTLANAVELRGNIQLGDTVQNGTLTLAGPALLTGNRTLTSLSEVVLSGSLSGAYSLNASGPGYLTLSGSNTFSGGVILADGTVRVAHDFALGSGSVTFSGGSLMNASPTELRTLANALVTSGSVTVGDTLRAGSLRLDGSLALAGSTTFAVQSDTTLMGVLSGNFGLTKEGVGEFRLAGSNTFAGPAQINAGTLTVAGGSALADTLEARLGTAGTLAVESSEILAALQGAGFVDLRSGTLTLAGTSNSDYTGAIRGPGALNKTAQSILRLAGSSTFAGGVTITAGTLQVGADTALGTGTLTASGARISVDSTAARTLQNEQVFNGALSLGSSVHNGSLTFAGSTTMTSALDLTVDSLVTLQGTIRGGFGITKTGAGDLVLGGSNLFSGSIQLNGGSLVLAGGNALLNTGSVVVVSGATLRLAASEEFAAVSGLGRVALGSSTLTLSGASDGLFAGIISGQGALVKTADSQLVLTGENTFSGSTTVVAGTLRIGAGGTAGSLSGLGAIVNASTLVFDRSDAITQGVGFGQIRGSGRVLHLGSGTLGLAGANAYTGVTTVEVGTLSLATGVSLATSKLSFRPSTTLHMQTGWTLGAGVTQELEVLGTATTTTRIVGNLTAASSATLSLGNAAQLTLSTLTGDLNLAGGVVKLRLNQPLLTGFGGDALDITGNLSLGTSLVQARITAFGATADYGRYRIMQYSGSLSGYLFVDASQTVLGSNRITTVEYDLAQKRLNAVVLDPRGFLLSWGNNATGALGGSLTTALTSPRAYLDAPAPEQVAFGAGHALIIDASGSLYAVGTNQNGQLGEGNTKVSKNAASNNVSYPVQFFYGRKVISVAAGSQHSVAVADDGRVYAWGSTANGRLGVGATTAFNFAYPTQVFSAGTLSGKFIRSVVSGGSSSAHTLALDAGGTLYAWGANDRGQLGVGDNFERTQPAAVSRVSGALLGKTVTQASASTAHSMAVAGGTAFAWGRNASGELGDGTQTDRNVPVAVTGGSLAGKTVKMVAAGENHSLALDTDGNLYGWGGNLSGQLGRTASSAVQTTPVRISSGSLAGKAVVAIAAGANHSIALTADGLLIAWGNNANGQLGDRTTTASSTPQQVAIGTPGFTGVAAGGNQSAALGGIYFSGQPSTAAAVVGKSVQFSAIAQLAGDVFNVRGSEITYGWSPAGTTPTLPSTSIVVPSGTFTVATSAAYTPLSISRNSDTVTITPISQSAPTAPPVLVTSPVNVIAAASGATVTLVTTGTVTSYLWERFDGSSWIPVTGSTDTETTSSLTVSAANSGRYRVTAGNAIGTLRDTGGNVVVPEVYVRSFADLAGTYQALMRNTALPTPAADSATDLRYAGRVTITVTATGSFSGALEYQGTSYALTGAFDPATASSSVSVQRGSLPSIEFTLRLNDADLQNLSISASATELLRTANSTRVAWMEQSALSPISLKSAATLRREVGSASAITGKTFSVVFRGSSPTGNTPGGYAILSVSASGIVSMVGRLGEGSDSTTPVSNSTRLSEENIASVYRSMYGVGQLAGVVQLRDTNPGDADNNAALALDGDWEWKNPGVVSSINVTYQGTGYTLMPSVQILSGTGSGAQGVAVLTAGRVVGVNVTNPGYGYVTPPTVSIVKSAAQAFSTTFRAATATASISAAFTRKLTPYGSVYTPPTDVASMTAAQMLGTASEATLSLRAFANAGDVFLQPLSPGTWGLNNTSIVKPTTSLTATWNTTGGTQENNTTTISLLSITPTAASPLRTLSLRSTTGGLSVTLSPTGVVLQNDVSSGGIVVPRGVYGVVSRDSIKWTEWCVR